ncbi:MAG: SDR family NAD(P)-dependent oxidoreductase [Planctomycetota bacterium]
MSSRTSESSPTPRTALVTGANRGIGLAVVHGLLARGLRVVATARRLDDARALVSVSRNPLLIDRELDLAREESVDACARSLAQDGIAIDVLVNNGAVLFEGDVLTTSSDEFRAAVDVNLLGALWTTRAFLPGMLARGFGRIVNLSSGWGSFAEGLSGPASYSITKAALCAATLVTAHALRGDVKVNACCPGWVRTRMGGDDAELSPEQGADTVLWLATLPESGPSGGFFRERQPIPW